MPSLLTTRLDGIDKTYPTWVSAEAATRKDESLDPGLFHPALWDRLLELLEVPVDPVQKCVPVGEDFQAWVNPPDVSSLEATFGSAHLVIRGRVTGREFGFDRGIPGQLFPLVVDETLKGKNDREVYYFFVPVGRFQVGKIEICKTDYRFPKVPEVGDEAVLLIPEVAAGDPFLDLRFAQGLIVFRGTDAFVPGFANANAAKTMPRAQVLADLIHLSGGVLDVY